MLLKNAAALSMIMISIYINNLTVKQLNGICNSDSYIPILVCNQVIFKKACSVAETSWTIEIVHVASLLHVPESELKWH